MTTQTYTLEPLCRCGSCGGEFQTQDSALLHIALYLGDCGGKDASTRREEGE